MFIYTVGYIYRKHYQYGLKKIEYKNLVLLTVLIVVNSIVVMTVAKVATIELSEKHKLVFSGAFIAVIVGIFIQLGVNFSTYLEQVRMTQAKHLLETTNIKITDLYVAVGYNNLTSFRRAFKKKYGVAPNALRE